MTDNNGITTGDGDTGAGARSDEEIDAMIAGMFEPIPEDRFEEMIAATTATADTDPATDRPEDAAVPEPVVLAAHRRTASDTRRRGSQRLLAGLSAAAAITLVVVVATQVSGDGSGDVAVRPRPTAGDEPVASGRPRVRFAPADGVVASADDLARTAEVVESRLAALAVTATVTVTEGDVVVTFPQAADRDTVVMAVTTVGDLQFRPVIAMTGDEYELGPSGLDGNGVETARRSDDTGTPAIQLTLREGADGIDAFNALAAACHATTAACPSGQLAIVVDGTVVSAPRINAPSFERDLISISGVFTAAEADDLAALLRSGAMPVRLVER